MVCVAFVTVKVNVNVSEPALLVAVTVQVVDDCTELGVPVISPVDEFKLSPLGSDGDEENVAELPLLVIVTLVIADP